MTTNGAMAACKGRVAVAPAPVGRTGRGKAVGFGARPPTVLPLQKAAQLRGGSRATEVGARSTRTLLQTSCGPTHEHTVRVSLPRYGKCLSRWRLRNWPESGKAAWESSQESMIRIAASSFSPSQTRFRWVVGRTNSGDGRPRRRGDPPFQHAASGFYPKM